MNAQPKNVIIAGNNAEAWVTAALLSKSLPDIEITMLGEHATNNASHNLYPDNLYLLQHLGLSEQELLAQTDGCFNLGTLFQDWVTSGQSSMQPFGTHGGAMDYVQFQHYIIKQRLVGKSLSYEDYSLSAQAARQNKFARPKMDSQTILATLNYAITVNGEALVDALKEYSKALSVSLVNNSIAEVLISDDSNIEALVDDSGTRYEADLYIDCTGQTRRLLSALPGYDSQGFSHLFKADTVLSWQTANETAPQNHATIIAMSNGWLREVTDQGQIFRQYYFNSQAETPDEALAISQKYGLQEGAYEMSASNPDLVEAPWLGNCISVGSAVAYLEPLDVSSLHGLITDVFRLLDLFPRSSNWGAQRYEYNRKTTAWYGNVVVMNACRYHTLDKSSSLSIQNDLPEAVQRKFELFKDNGQLAFFEDEPFRNTYQIAMFLGSEIWPEGYDPLVDNFDIKRLEQRFNDMLQEIDKTLAFMPTHSDFLARDLA